VINFRDVAGSGLALKDGARMRRGVVYRSGKLQYLTVRDKAVLREIGVSTIIDLRTPNVIKKSPDPRVRGIEYRPVNIFATSATPTARLDTVEDAKDYMRQRNRDFVADRKQRAKIAQVLEIIADAPAPVVIHCTEGKDRTGWISALLQLNAGADETTVMEEYLESNVYRQEAIAERVDSVLKLSGKLAADIEQAQLEVEKSYLQAALSEMETRFTNVSEYLTKGLGLDKDTITKLATVFRDE
jgi:protein-tyrosine phosphatase